MDYQPKPRLVNCPICQKDYEIETPNPKCPSCGATCITVVTSVVSGERITGNNTFVPKDTTNA